MWGEKTLLEGKVSEHHHRPWPWSQEVGSQSPVHHALSGPHLSSCEQRACSQSPPQQILLVEHLLDTRNGPTLLNNLIQSLYQPFGAGAVLLFFNLKLDCMVQQEILKQIWVEVYIPPIL